MSNEPMTKLVKYVEYRGYLIGTINKEKDHHFWVEQ
jgi:hypothetical protein